MTILLIIVNVLSDIFSYSLFLFTELFPIIYEFLIFLQSFGCVASTFLQLQALVASLIW